MEGVGRSFQNLWLIARHEFRIYFLSPIIYMIGAVWLLLSGLFFVLGLSQFTGLISAGGFPVEPSMSQVLSPMAFLNMFFAPAFTMRLISEELRNGTHELLFTAPVSDWQIVVGKWLGAYGVMIVLILISLVYPLILFAFGNPEPGPIIAGYIGFVLWTGAALAIGVFSSSLTQHQLVALFVGIGVILFLWLANLFNQLITLPAATDVFTQLTVTTHYHNTMLSRGIIDPVDIAYFLGIMAISLFVGTQILSTRRWRP